MQLRPLPARVEDEDEDDEVAVNADSDAGDTAASVLHPPSPTFIYSDAVWRSPLRARRLRAVSLLPQHAHKQAILWGSLLSPEVSYLVLFISHRVGFAG